MRRVNISRRWTHWFSAPRRRPSRRAAARLGSFERLESRALLDAGLAGLAAGGPEGAVEGESDGSMADFSLLDLNSSSARFNQNVSPRDYLGQVSAWYFGQAT